MPNIILTEYCNLKCPYCFASKMIEEKTDDTKNISLEQLDVILKWLLSSTTSIERIGLIGGEPTLHPQFKEILGKINSFNEFTNTSSIIFTNGINLGEFLPVIGPNMSILINVNKLTGIFLNKLNTILNEINYLNWFKIDKVILGCNLYQSENTYSYFWNIVDKYPDISRIRMSITAPNSKELKSNKELYYTKMKPILLEFLEETKKRKIKIEYDCNQIPLCLLNDEEQNLINQLGKFDNFCDPVIDITPDFKATCCFGVYDTPIQCNNFNNIEELFRYFKNQMVIRTINNNTSMCKDCKKLQLAQCQGGCLSFSSIG